MSKKKLKLYWYCKQTIEKKEPDVCPKFGLVKFTILTILKNITKIISAEEQKGSRIKRFRKHKRGDVDDALLEWLKQHSSDNVPMSEALLMTSSVLPKY